MKRIIWAVDAFQEDARLGRRTQELLGSLAERTGAKIEPVYVLSPEQLNISVELSTPWVTEYKPAAEKAIAGLTRRAGLPSVMRPKVLVNKVPSVTAATRALSTHALSSGADLIVVGTHARKGLARLVVGSFAESLLLVSKVPVLVVSPTMRTASIKNCETILFATDFSRVSLGIFDRVVDLARAVGAAIKVFHHVQNPIEPLIQSGVYLLGGGWVSVSAYLEEQTLKSRARAKALVARAVRAGVSADFTVESGRQSVTEAILGAAGESRACLIAMAGQSGAIATALLGSIARQIVRATEYPVWIVHVSRAKRR